MQFSELYEQWRLSAQGVSDALTGMGDAAHQRGRLLPAARGGHGGPHRRDDLTVAPAGRARPARSAGAARRGPAGGRRAVRKINARPDGSPALRGGQSASGSGRPAAPARGAPADASSVGSEQMQFGRYYEEFEVGAVYKHWPGKTVTEYDDHLFCLLTMNHHPLHMDVNYAEKTTDFGKNVVVGNYIYSLLLGMSVPDVSGKAIANLEVESLRHVAPTFHGDTIYGETTVLDKTESKSKDDRGVVYVETIGYKQDGTIVCIFRRKVMVPKRSYGEARGGEQPGRPEPTPR